MPTLSYVYDANDLVSTERWGHGTSHSNPYTRVASDRLSDRTGILCLDKANN